MSDRYDAYRLAKSDAFDDFTLERLLRLFTTAPKAAWRHDVDVSLEAAAKMARFAHLAGVRCTFYIRATGEEYNPFSAAAARCIASINSTGHRLGLHCDVNGKDPRGVVRRDRRLFSDAYPGVFCLEYVSFHMPDPEHLWKDYAGFTSAYASEWEGRYLSDSRREFGPEKEALVSDDMQIALHPEHWFA